MAKKQSKFADWCSEWMRFDDGTYVLSAETHPTKELALAQLHTDFDEGYPQYLKDYALDDIGEDRVRHMCQGSEEDRCMWYLGQNGKGSLPVWTYRLKLDPAKDKAIYL
jgi:hypothetical protein